jgi:glycine cleavage system aminomethyltransferase T
MRTGRESVLELSEEPAAVVCCYAAPRALDAFPAAADAFRFRVARDQLMLVAGADATSELLEHAQTYLLEADADGVVINDSGGWSRWALAGTSDAALARLTAIAIPDERPAFVQGTFAHVPCKAIVLHETVHLLVPASFAHHFVDRVLADCADLGAHVTTVASVVAAVAR